MLTLTKQRLILPLLWLAGTALADDNDLQDFFSRTLEAGCVQGLVQRAVADYSTMTGIGSESIPADVRTGLEAATRPLHAMCSCFAKASVKVQSESDQKKDIAIDLSGLSARAECAPDPATNSVVRRNFMRLVEASPPPVRSIKTKRKPFTLELGLHNANPSVFAAYTRPPDGLTKFVFLAPGTGIACDLQNLCVDKSPLEIVKASELLVSNSRSTGKGGSRSLQQVIDQFGGSSRVITSGSNFSNFATTVRSSAYAVSFIDGVPVEKTTAKKVWLVFFASQIPTNPRAIDFSPATVSVYEVEFVD
jgi:hypothetical protein